MPKQPNTAPKNDQPTIEEGSNKLTVEDMVADDKPRAEAKPVNVTELPNGVVIEDY